MTPNERIFFEPISGRVEKWVRENLQHNFFAGIGVGRQK
jgi:hypothetical protein